MIKVYATSNNGEGKVMEIFSGQCLDELEIPVSTFSKSTVISFFHDKEETEENPTFYKTIIHSKEWQEWEKLNEDEPKWDCGESRECGWISEGHWRAFLEWIRKGVV